MAEGFMLDTGLLSSFLSRETHNEIIIIWSCLSQLFVSYPNYMLYMHCLLIVAIFVSMFFDIGNFTLVFLHVVYLLLCTCQKCQNKGLILSLTEKYNKRISIRELATKK